jgi:EAL domain-containing protein (putative c-di-GMP-specific phosphodiesterase class I)
MLRTEAMRPRQRGVLGGRTRRGRPPGSVGRLRAALERDSLALYGQPILDLSSGTLVRHELLLRLIDGDEVISAREFLWAAEADGEITEVDRWVLGEAVALAAGGMAVSVNLSAESLMPWFVHFLQRQLATTGADPGKLVLEVSEAKLADDEARGREFVRALRELGCGLALDHFGARRNGWTRLRGLPADYLKIDAGFVRHLPRDLGSRRVIERMVELAHHADQVTVAKGVEDVATVQLLNELGVDQAQGYALGRPAPLEVPTLDEPREARSA